MLVVVVNILAFKSAFAQKPPVEFSDSKKWAFVSGEAISNDGNYISYYIYNQPPGSRKLIIQSTNNNWKKEFTGASAANFTNDSKQIIFKIGADSLYQLTLGKDDIDYIPPVSENNLPKENQRAFMVEKRKDNQLVYLLWYYKAGMDSAVMLVNNETPGIGEGFVVANGSPDFSKDGNGIFFSLERKETGKPKPGAVQLDVWSYRDMQLQSTQLATLKNGNTEYAAVINIDDKKVIRLEQENETVAARSDDFILVKHGLVNDELYESNWNSADYFSYYLVSVKDGSRKLLRDHVVNPHGGLGLSPEGKWIVYYDFKQGNYCSYEIATGLTRNITKGSHATWTDEENDRPTPSLCWVPWRNTWLANDEAVLIYDNYDIWQVDPAGIKLPVNLTNSYGRKHHIKFELPDEGEGLKNFSIEKKSMLFLRAINRINKDRGFYSKKLGVTGDPGLCTMGAYVYGSWLGHEEYNFPPLKARDANIYLVRRSSATEASNLFETKDFKEFTRLTNLQPQKDYNWLTTELIHWKTSDGTNSTGILYKPEDFDSGKKYPVIFQYYEERSDELNLFIWPRENGSTVTIPWFVSHGYLVFVPDIHYKTGEPGQSAYNAVVSAAKYLSKKPWVDTKKMGLQGHSFGAYETNYIITHTNIFAAACSASGMSDLISYYGSDAPDSHPENWTERSQGRMNATLWQIPSLYISNSPIFKADKVATPLLMMNNKGDNAVPFSQGVEFFTALRRLGKKVWMLQYDEGRHSGPVDFNTRMNQFFNHYLKGEPAPVWMTRGIQAKMKEVDDGLKLDTEIKTPGPGLQKN